MKQKQQKLWLYLGAGVLGAFLLRMLFSDKEAQASSGGGSTGDGGSGAGDGVDPDTVESVGAVYKPGSAKQIALFEKAAAIAGLPKEWASDTNLHNLLNKESIGGKVGIPNYLWAPWLGTTPKKMWADPSMWPKVWKVIRDGNAHPSYTGIQSHAAGLGQMQPSNMKLYQPSGLAGIGIPIEEAVGMLRYIKGRYVTPKKAWEFWQDNQFY